MATIEMKAHLHALTVVQARNLVVRRWNAEICSVAMHSWHLNDSSWMRED
jgi:hypothetical protein